MPVFLPGYVIACQEARGCASIGVLWLISVPQAGSYGAGIAGAMEKSKHNNLVVFHCKVNRVRESSEQAASELGMDLLVKQRSM